jgi:hypothetical protein
MATEIRFIAALLLCRGGLIVWVLGVYKSVLYSHLEGMYQCILDISDKASEKQGHHTHSSTAAVQCAGPKRERLRERLRER